MVIGGNRLARPPLPMNEDFGDDGDNVTNNWARGNPNAKEMKTITQVLAQMDPGSLEYANLSALAQYGDTYTFADQYAYDNYPYPKSPPTVWPGVETWEDNVYWREQRYHADSEQSGEGLCVKEHTRQMRCGSARQE